MRSSSALLALALVACHGVPALDPATLVAPPPGLPDRQPFGFGGDVTGGGDAARTGAYVVDNMADLRAALTLAAPRVVYVRGRIRGSGDGPAAVERCQRYIDDSTVPRFNFTLYLRALNTSYTAAVREAAAAGAPFAGRNATEYLALLGRQNGWRGVAQNRQKAQESIDARGDLTLVGWDRTAHLDGVSLVFNGQRNVVVRNLRLTPPQDCFPAPEGQPPGPWNARYDAVSLVATRGVWLDGNVFTDGPTAVAPEPLPGGWEVDRFDGLVDAEDGTDYVTFSHNEISNHHKSLMWGGGEKEGPQDIGRMRFTVFGNRFHNSLSRNPLMRFGTFYIVNNVFANYNNAGPRFFDDDGEGEGEGSAGAVVRRRDDPDPPAYVPDFQYHMGVYNMSSVLVAGNYFAQTGTFPNDATRVFTFSHLATPARPATLCSPPDLPAGAATALGPLTWPRSALNGTPLNLTATARRTFAWYLAGHGEDDAQPGGLAIDCAGFAPQEMPATFGSAAEVLDYVEANVGQF